MTPSLTHWILLNSITGIGPVRFKKLLEQFGSPEAALKERPDALAKFCGISSQTIAQVHDKKCMQAAEEQLARAHKENIRIMTCADNDFPVMLKEIFAPPPVLYIKGKTTAFSRHAIGIVGTRSPTEYGKSATAHIVSELVGNDMVIVSGLARGIDTVAHRACIDNDGLTVAVLGCGLDYRYPASNRDLRDKIAETGALVSEFPLGFAPEPFNFPRRNRIISGLSAGVVVVEAPQKSGSLITANYALQQDRDVYAVPGSIFSPQSAGTIGLIQNGALAIRCAEDIMKNMEVLSCVKKAPKAASTKPMVLLSMGLMNPTEHKLYDALSEAPLRFDQISELTGMPGGDLFNVLLSLELKGLCRQVAGQNYVRM